MHSTVGIRLTMPKSVDVGPWPLIGSSNSSSQIIAISRGFLHSVDLCKESLLSIMYKVYCDEDLKFLIITFCH